MPPVITGYRERGILRRMSATPVRPSALLSAQMRSERRSGPGVGAGSAWRSAGSRSTYALPQQAFGYALALLLTAAAALALGALVSALARTAKIATAIGTAVFFPSMFCAGVWLPVRGDAARPCATSSYSPRSAPRPSALDQASTGDWPAWSHLGRPRRVGGRCCRPRPPAGSGGSRRPCRLGGDDGGRRTSTGGGSSSVRGQPYGLLGIATLLSAATAGLIMPTAAIRIAAAGAGRRCARAPAVVERTAPHPPARAGSSATYYAVRWAIGFALTWLNPFFAFYAVAGLLRRRRADPRPALAAARPVRLLHPGGGRADQRHPGRRTRRSGSCSPACCWPTTSC